MIKLTKYIYLSCGIFISLSCDIFVEYDNVFDPNDSRYVPPITEIIEAPAEGDTLSENNAFFQWRHADQNYWPDSLNNYRIPASIFYSYRINYKGWSPWVSGYDLLNEPRSYWAFDTTNGLHLFELTMMDDQDYMIEIKSQYPTNIIEEEWATRSFTVDALHGPALTVFPLASYSNPNDPFSISVKAEDLFQMMGLHILLDYEPEMLEMVTYNIESDEGEFLLESQAEYVTEFTFVEHDTLQGIFDFNIALAGGDPDGISGSGTVIEFVFYPKGIIGETSVVILPESTIRNIFNETTVNEIRSGLVVIQNE